MAATFKCNLVTPERSMFDADVVYADLPAHDGQMGILTRHAPLLVQLGRGGLDLDLGGGKKKQFRIQGGFAQMRDNRLTILAEKAEEVGA